MPEPLPAAARQQALDLGRLRGREVSFQGEGFLAEADARGADQGAGEAFLQQVVQQPRGGRLAVGPGHAEHAQVVGRMPVERRRQQRQRGPGVRHALIGHAAPRQASGQLGLTHHRHRARLHRLAQVVVGVEALATARDEQRPGRDAVVPLHDGPNVACAAVGRARAERVAQQDIETHG